MQRLALFLLPVVAISVVGLALGFLAVRRRPGALAPAVGAARAAIEHARARRVDEPGEASA